MIHQLVCLAIKQLVKNWYYEKCKRVNNIFDTLLLPKQFYFEKYEYIHLFSFPPQWVANAAFAKWLDYRKKSMQSSNTLQHVIINKMQIVTKIRTKYKSNKKNKGAITNFNMINQHHHQAQQKNDLAIIVNMCANNINYHMSKIIQKHEI